MIRLHLKPKDDDAVLLFNVPTSASAFRCMTEMDYTPGEVLAFEDAEGDNFAIPWANIAYFSFSDISEAEIPTEKITA